MKSKIFFILAFLTAFVITSCGSTISPFVEYKPPAFPIKFIIEPSKISVEGDTSVVTPLGTFTVGASLPIVDSSQILVILRDKNKNTDVRYQINAGRNLHIVTNGKTVVDIGSDGIVIIDITDASVQTVEIRENVVETQVPTTNPFSDLSSTSSSDRVLDLGSLTVDTISWSPDGTRLAVGTEDHDQHVILVWNLATGQFEQKFITNSPTLDPTNHPGSTNYVRWSPNGQWITSGGGDGKIRIWDTTTWQIVSTFSENENIEAVAWSPNGNFLAISDAYGAVTFLRSSDWQTEFSIPGHGIFGISTLSWSPDSQKIAAGANFIDLQSQSIIGTFEIENNQGYFNMESVAWSPNGSSIAISGSHNAILLIDSQSMKYTGGGLGCAPSAFDSVGKVTWSLNGMFLACSVDKQIFVWDTSQWLKCTPKAGQPGY